jgi:hypothetical protein
MGSPPISDIGRTAFQARALSFIQSSEGPNRLATAILEQANESGAGRCVVDGIRNLSTYELLMSKTQGSVALLFVHTPPDLAFDMYRAREAQGNLAFSYRDFLKIYDATVEGEIPSLGRNASAYVYNAFGLEALRRTLDNVVETLSGG